MHDIASSDITTIAPTRGWTSLGLSEVWRYRELLYFLTWRDIKVRYKQTVVGIAWALIQPLANLVLFTIVFGRLAKLPSDGIPYPLFSLAGLVPWTFFSTALSTASNGLVNNSSLLTKVYFPRLALPVAAVLAALLDFLIALALLFGAMIVWRIVPSLQLLWLLPCTLLAIAAAMGTGLWLAALNAKFRDVRFVLPFLMQFWMFATPIVYSSSGLQQPWRTLYGLNPMVGVVEGYRWALFESGHAPGWPFAASAVMTLVVLLSGIAFFRRMERTFADVV